MLVHFSMACTLHFSFLSSKIFSCSFNLKSSSTFDFFSFQICEKIVNIDSIAVTYGNQVENILFNSELVAYFINL